MFRRSSGRRHANPEIIHADRLEEAANEALAQVADAVDTIGALVSVRHDYVTSVFAGHLDDDIAHSANDQSETGKAYMHQVQGAAELACVATLKLTALPDEPPAPYNQVLVSALTKGIIAQEAGMRLTTYGAVFTDLTGADTLQNRYAYEYRMPAFEFALQAHALEMGDLAAKTTMPTPSVTGSVLSVVRSHLETGMNLEEVIALQEYSAAIDAGLRELTD